MLNYQRLPFIFKIIKIKLINWHHNNLSVEYFGIDKTKKLNGQKYY